MNVVLISCMVYDNSTHCVSLNMHIRPRDMDSLYESAQLENYFLKLYIQKQSNIKQLCRLLLMVLS